MAQNWQKNKTASNKGLIAPLVIFCLLAVFLVISTYNITTTSEDQRYQQLQTALNRAVVQCYAIEGAYPPSVEYLTDHYGVVIDTSKYAVHYEVFAQNIMPTITVVDLTGRQEAADE